MSNALESLGKTIIGLGLPLVGASIIGAPGAIAANLIDSVSKLFGVDSKNPEDLLAKIQNDPEAFLKLKQIENNYKVQLEQLNIQNNQNILVDKQDARETQSKKLSQHYKDPMYPFLAVSITIGFFLSLLALYFIKDNVFRDVVCTMIGVLCANFKDVYNYYFGSSASADRKDKYIQRKNQP
jgi:hypothetical protein